MSSNILWFVYLVALATAPLVHAQNAEKELDAALKQASEAAGKMGVTMPDVKKMMENDAQAEARKEAKKKEQVKAVMNAQGPVAFPEWMPKIPEFTPAGPAAKKILDEKPQIVQTGTSPLPPIAIADAWEKFKNDKYSLGRMNSNINGTVTQTVTYTDLEDATQEVRMEAKREPRDKITRVTISSPLPMPAEAKDE